MPNTGVTSTHGECTVVPLIGVINTDGDHVVLMVTALPMVMAVPVVPTYIHIYIIMYVYIYVHEVKCIEISYRIAGIFRGVKFSWCG